MLQQKKLFGEGEKVPLILRKTEDDWITRTKDSIMLLTQWNKIKLMIITPEIPISLCHACFVRTFRILLVGLKELLNQFTEH